MTYCLALKLRDGLVFASDSRTTAGVDYISTYRKMHVFQPSGDRLLVVLTSGNLATTQEVLDNLRRDLAAADCAENLATVSYVFEAARYVGNVLCTVVQHYAATLGSSGADLRATLIVGGQIAGRPPEIYLVYPEGNYVAATWETPYLQLGEFKYGKPILSRLAGGRPVTRRCRAPGPDLVRCRDEIQPVGRPAAGAGDLSRRRAEVLPAPVTRCRLGAAAQRLPALERKAHAGVPRAAQVRLGARRAAP